MHDVFTRYPAEVLHAQPAPRLPAQRRSAARQCHGQLVDQPTEGGNFMQ
jgi:hypothetical protein